MVDWNMTIADVVKKMKEDGYDLSKMDNTERADVLFATIAQAQTEITAEEEAKEAERVLREKRELFNRKREEFMMRAGIRFSEISDAAGTYELSDFVSNITQAFSEVKAEMVAEAHTRKE